MKGKWETWWGGGLEEIEEWEKQGGWGLSWQPLHHFLYLPVGMRFKGRARFSTRLWMDELAGAQFQLFIAQAPGDGGEERGWGACTGALLGRLKCLLRCVYVQLGCHKPNNSFSIIGIRVTSLSSPSSSSILLSTLSPPPPFPRFFQLSPRALDEQRRQK